MDEKFGSIQITNSTNNMNNMIKEIRLKYPDAIAAKLTMDKVYSNRDIIEKMQNIYGLSIMRINHSGKKVELITSQEWGDFIAQIKPGTHVCMTGAEVEMRPELKSKVWKVSTLPTIMCGETVCWLDGYSGAYSCECLRLATNEDIPF